MKSYASGDWIVYPFSNDYNLDDLLKCVEMFEGNEVHETVIKKYCIEVLKSDYRSVVIKFTFNGKALVAKRPIEKHSRAWARFVTQFRDSEVVEASKKLERVKRVGLIGNQAIAAFEKRIKNRVADSWQVYTYLEGCVPPIEVFGKVKEILVKIHQQGYLHGDSQLQNFLYTLDQQIAVIDVKLKHNRLGNYGRSMEYEYLCRSNFCFKPYFVKERKWFSYKLYIFFKFLQLRFRDVKKIREWFGYKKNQA